MEADFSGYATKAGLKCADGRTILPGAFQHQDKMKVPLVWQHGHKDPENVLGHVLLENRDDGVYCYGFFNDTPKAVHAKTAVDHKDITMLSIWANELMERAKRVMHGAIREVSLVLSGANPGALIENVTIRHSDDDLETLDDEVIIYTGLTIEHGNGVVIDTKVKHDDTSTGEEEDTSLQDIYDSLTEEQQQLLHYMIGEAVTAAETASHTQLDIDDDAKDVYESLSDNQKQFVHSLIGEAIKKKNTIQSTDIGDTDINDVKKGTAVRHNVFEDDDTETVEQHVISHDDMKALISDAESMGSLKKAVAGYALAHGIENIDILFPDAVNFDKEPQFLQRRVEWVGSFLGAVRKSPFSRIKTFSADITLEEARAKGYVKGEMKKEEFFGVSRRETTPTTVYKKQSLDRDDVIDITDFDVVAWLKSEMRLMLDEELARAALIGDGRDVAHEDKINEQNIRPIAKEHELFATTVNVNIRDAASSVQEVIDAIVANRKSYKGTGTPNFYTSETLISMFLLLRDQVGRRIYKSLDEVASELRVAQIVPVEAMEDEEYLLGIIVNPVDYVMGATRGGEVSMFDDFDIDYNKQKYLIETRVSGALTKLKSALVIRGVAAGDVVTVPAAPEFDAATGELTITDTVGVVYKNSADVVVNAAGSPYEVASGETETITATPTAGHYFETSDGDSWEFTAD